jgi:sporulation inhibitor KapD
MRVIIYSVDEEKRILYIRHQRRLIKLILSYKNAAIFLPILQKGYLIDVDVKKIHIHLYKIKTFKQVISLKPYRIMYDLDMLRLDMQDFMNHIHHFVFIDFEMSMPSYQHKGFFQSEIIQFGLIVTDQQFNHLYESMHYIYDVKRKPLTERTKKFLQLDQETYDQKAMPYDLLYETLSYIKKTYHPKWVVWGKNDVQVLKDSFSIHQKSPILDSNDFVDLLKLHKDYYHLKDDLGLLKAHSMYYKQAISQSHDALDDAKMTLKITQAFMKLMHAHRRYLWNNY